MTAGVLATMSPGGRSLLAAMRRNLELLIELEKTAPGDVAIITEALVSHLRSWKPMAATSVPAPLDIAPVAPVEAVERLLADGGRYRIASVDECAVVTLTDHEGDKAVASLPPGEVEMLRADLASVGRAGR